MALISGLYPFQIQFVGGYPGEQEVGAGKHKDIDLDTGKKEIIVADYVNSVEAAIDELKTDSNIVRNSLVELYSNIPMVYTYSNTSPASGISHAAIDTGNLGLDSDALATVKATGTTGTSYIDIINGNITYSDTEISFDITSDNYTAIKISLYSPISDVSKYIALSGVLTTEVTLT